MEEGKIVAKIPSASSQDMNCRSSGDHRDEQTRLESRNLNEDTKESAPSRFQQQSNAALNAPDDEMDPENVASFVEDI